MISVSSDFKEKMAESPDFGVALQITLNNGNVISVDKDQLWSDGFSYEEATSNSGTFDAGAAVIGKLTVRLNNMYKDFTGLDFTDAVIKKAQIYLDLGSHTESIDKGVYTVDTATYDNGIITLECLDNIHKFDIVYSNSTLAFPATAYDIVKDACNCCGVTLSNSALTFSGYKYQFLTKPESEEETTFRDVLSWVGQCTGNNWKCNGNGELTAIWYDASGLSDSTNAHMLDTDVVTDVVPELDDVVITGVKVVTEDEDGNEVSSISGDDGYMVTIEQNDLVNENNVADIAKMAGARLVGLTFRPITISLLQDPTIEAGDGVIVHDADGNTYRTLITNVSFGIDSGTQLTNDAEAAIRNSAQRFSQSTKIYQKINRKLTYQKTEFEKGLDKLSQAMDEKQGLYPIEVKEGDGSTTLYFCDTPRLADATTIIKLNSAGWGMSSDSGSSWNTGALVDGTMIAKILDTIGVNANWIKTGALTIQDADGNVIFKADADNQSVTMNGDHVTIGGKSATEAISDAAAMANSALSVANNAEDEAAEATQTAQEALAQAAQARSVTITLTNDYQTIPVDADGYYQNFPSCSTTAQVLFGTEDVTENCTYAISKSDSIVGSWNGTTKTYTVTALTEDTGYVDIKATYYSSISVTKRFQLSKLYAGDSGRTVANQIVEYASGTSGTKAPQTGWSTVIPAIEDGEYLWGRTTTTFSDGSTSIGYTVSRNGTKGDSGRSVTGQKVQYCLSDDGVNTTAEQKLITDGMAYIVDENGNNIISSSAYEWQDTIPESIPGWYLWTRTAFTYSDGTTEYVYSVAHQGENGEAPSIEVSKSGKVTTITVTNADGSASTEKVNDGEDGTKGANGYIHVKYSDDGGKTFTANNGETPGEYLGRYEDNTEADSTDVNDYTWALIKGDSVTVSGYKVEYCIVYEELSEPPESNRIVADVGPIITSDGEYLTDHYEWVENIPSSYMKGTGYLWSRTTTTYSDGSETVTYSVSKQVGDDQIIKRVANYYLVSALSSGVTINTTGWTVNTQTMTAEKPYLWNYEVIYAVDGSIISSSEPCIIGRYGMDGSEGKGIRTITEYYQKSTSNETVSGTWQTTVPVITSTEKYLWNYEVITYTDGSTHETTKRVIGVYGDSGEDGVTYTLQGNRTTVERIASTTYSPGTLKFYFYQRAGSSASRYLALCRFQLVGTTSGGATTTLYTSSEDENSFSYYLNGRGVAYDGFTVTAYQKGGTTVVLDSVTVSVVASVKSLTRDQIFNLLTNNEAWKGIYKDGNELYINFTYAKGGSLTLGGAASSGNSGGENGVLKLLNDKGNTQMILNNGGQVYYNRETGKPLIRLSDTGIFFYVKYTNTQWKAFVIGEVSDYIIFVDDDGSETEQEPFKGLALASGTVDSQGNESIEDVESFIDYSSSSDTWDQYIYNYVYDDSKWYYKPGDTFDTTMHTAGVLTGGKKSLNFTIPLCKPVRSDVKAITANPAGFKLRQNGKYIEGGASSYSYRWNSIEINKTGGGSLRVIVTLVSANSEATNNAPIAVSFSGTIKFS